MIDIVYILGTGSTWEDNELRYSLRSVEKYLKNYGNIYIIGNNRPSFLDNIRYYRVEETSIKPQKNVANCLYVASTLEKLSNNFLFFNDDFFLLKNTDALTYPTYHNPEKGNDLVKNCKDENYKRKIENTINKIQELTGKNPYSYYDIHLPFVFNKVELNRVLRWVQYHDDKEGMLIRTLYGNLSNVKGNQVIGNSRKINIPLEIDTLKELNRNSRFFSIGDDGLNDDMKQYLQLLYPNKSKYEI